MNNPTPNSPSAPALPKLPDRPKFDGVVVAAGGMCEGYYLCKTAEADRLACYEAGRASGASVATWQAIETAPKNPIRRVLLRWLSGNSEWICIGAWASAKDSPSLKVAGCPREGWMPDAGTCIPRNQKDCVGWMPLPAAPAAVLVAAPKLIDHVETVSEPGAVLKVQVLHLSDEGRACLTTNVPSQAKGEQP